MNTNQITEEDALRLESFSHKRAVIAAEIRAIAAEEALIHEQIKARYGLADGDRIDLPSRAIARKEEAK